MNHIHYPNQTTYWIIFNEDQTQALNYGITEPNQCTDTLLELTTYLDEEEWKTVLEHYGINPDPDPESDLEPILSE